MKILKKERHGTKRIIKLFGIKIYSYRKKENHHRSIGAIDSQVQWNTAYIRRVYNSIMCDKLSIADKRRIIEKDFMRRWGNKYFPDIEHPRSFNEKIQWLNLYYHNPLITTCTDKVTFKEYLAKEIGTDYIVPNIGVYDDVNQIDFDKLPTEYVLKSNWGGDSSEVYLRTAQSKLPIEELKTIANQWLHPINNLYNYYFNWGYKI